MVLEKTMRTTGMISEISENLKYMFRSNRIAAALLPMVIGMLPSPGGARLSCPMVEEAISEEPDDRIRAFVNYWFRHVWRDAFILYPGFIVATGFLEIPAIVYFFRIMPFMILAAIIGIFLGIVHVKKEELDNSVEHNIIVKRFMLAFSPIVFLVLLYLGLAALGIGDFGLQISCLITVLLLLKWKKIDLKQTREILKQSFSVNILLIVFGIMIFKEALFVSGILDPLTSIMGKYNISRYALFMALPFIGGFSTGIMVSAISLSFPILLPLGLGEEPIFGVVAFISAMSGLMVSPVHLCAVMSADYFSVPLSRVLKRTIIGETIIIAVAIISLILLK
jgi:integral membrane protein (TIGR00529 family)